MITSNDLTHLLASIGICTIMYIGYTLARPRKRPPILPIASPNPPTTSNVTSVEQSIRAPSDIIQLMYLEITNISQGIIVGFLVITVTKESLEGIFTIETISTLIFAVTSFIISIIFWVRYYFDTEIIQRSYSTLSILWFFVYVIAQAVSVSLISDAPSWLLSTGVFLLFSSGFYIINLIEIRRKQKRGVLSINSKYISWQTRRMVDLFVISAITFIGGYMVLVYPDLKIPAAIYAFCVAIWQLTINGNYRKFKFINTGA